MRAILLLLLLVVATNGFLGFGGVMEKAKGLLSGAKNVGQKIKNATIVSFKKFFNNTAFLKVRNKLGSMKDKIVKALKVTPQRLKAIMKKLKNVRFFKRDHVKQTGDTINEVNNNSGIVEDLYQGDMVLSEEQADEIVEDIEEVAAEVEGTPNRTKRQAFKDHRYPNTIWANGVNYYFHSFASRKMRSVFVKAAKLWEKDTCINFAENRMATDRIMVFPEQGCWSYEVDPNARIASPAFL
ncbi:Astacin domain-containing protein [Trichostrongylus colubriformis]|uniref:Astacin domain-containing protein n=1 Tax=Trichostrongylus colubriformis TaxID=6319 RepID=A0AAN8FT61_TRICO